MSATDNMIPAPAVRSKPLIIRHLPYFIGAAVLVALAAGMRFDGYILNILLSISYVALKRIPGVCNYLFNTTECELDGVSFTIPHVFLHS